MKAENDMATSEHEEGIPDADAGAQGTGAFRKGNKTRRESEVSGAPGMWSVSGEWAIHTKGRGATGLHGWSWTR